MESHAAKFCIKAMQQQETDPIRSLLMLNTSQIARKINADRRILGQLDEYNPETMTNQIKKRWNARLTTRWLSKSQTNKMVQLLSEQSHLVSFKFKTSWCFTPLSTCMIEDETVDHFLTICPFYVNLRAIWQPKTIQELVWNNKEEDWKNVVRFVEAAKRLFSSEKTTKNERLFEDDRRNATMRMTWHAKSTPKKRQSATEI